MLIRVGDFMNIQASMQIKEKVNSVRSRARRAEAEFDLASGEIQIMASRSIDLLGGTALGEVTDIVTKAKMACDKLYAECLTLIMLLDGECRPLLKDAPSAEAVGEVKELISELNEMSKIDNNFSASLNNRSLGDVATRRYTPSLEALSVQSFWETKYDMMPKASAEEICPQIAGNGLPRQVDAREAELAREAAARYKREMEIWNAESANVVAKRKNTVEKRLEEERSAKMKEIEDAYGSAVSCARESIQRLTAQKEAAEKRLPQLGFFAFGEKSSCKKTAENCAREILAEEEKISSAEESYAREKDELLSDMELYREEQEYAVEKELPLPPEPPKPVLRISDDYFFGVICEALKKYGKMSIDDFLQKCPELHLVSVAKAASFLRSMVKEGVIVREELNKKSYYHIR